MQGPKTSPSTVKSGNGVMSLMKMGNAGNTKSTRLPKGGCPRKGSKKSYSK